MEKSTRSEQLTDNKLVTASKAYEALGNREKSNTIYRFRLKDESLSENPGYQRVCEWDMVT